MFNGRGSAQLLVVMDDPPTPFQSLKLSAAVGKYCIKEDLVLHIAYKPCRPTM